MLEYPLPNAFGCGVLWEWVRMWVSFLPPALRYGEVPRVPIFGLLLACNKLSIQNKKSTIDLDLGLSCATAYILPS